MKLISNVTKSRDGVTVEIATLLGENDINIESLDAEVANGTDVVTLSVDHYNRALEVLRDAGWNAVSEDAMLVRVKDEPGALARVAKRFLDADVSVHSIRIVHHEGDWGVIAVSADPIDKARELVKGNLLKE